MYNSSVSDDVMCDQFLLVDKNSASFVVDFKTTQFVNGGLTKLILFLQHINVTCTFL